MDDKINIESVIKKGVEQALNKPILNGKSALEWAEIGIHSQEQPQWISVKDRLPEPGMSVIIYGTPKEDPEHTDGKIAITHMSEWNLLDSRIKTKPYWIMPWQYFSFDYTITHWMQMPEPPEVKQNETD